MSEDQLTNAIDQPGTREAQMMGCTCPVLDNNHGDGVPDGKGGKMFWMNADCPLHGTPEERKQRAKDTIPAKKTGARTRYVR